MQIHAISNKENFISFKNKKVSNKNTPNISVPYSQYSAENVRAKYSPHSLIDRMSPEMKGFFEFLKTVKIEDETLASKLKGYTFAFDKTFDIPAWTNFLSEMDSATAMFENETSTYEKSFLELLDSVKPIPELFNEKDFKPNKAINFLDEYYNRDDEEISKFHIKAQLDFMIEAAKSKMPVEDFVHDMFYFQSLMTKNGESVIAERNGVMGENQVNALKYALSVDKGSVESSNLEMLLDLVQSGVVGIHVFNNIPIKGKINSLVAEDIDKLYVAYSMGVKPIDAFVPTYKTKQSAEAELMIGDVYELDGEDKIFIVNRYGLSTQLGLDKETYFDLFPPIERYASTQGDIGNCWELTALNALYSDPQEREKILGLFSQDGNDIILRLPNGNYSKHIFKNGQFPVSADRRYFASGAKGIKFLEYVDGKESHADKIRFLMLQYREAFDAAKTDEERKIVDEKASRLIDLLEQDWDSVVVSIDKNQNWTFEEWKKEKHGFDGGSTVSRDGGNSSELFMRLLYPIEVYNKDEIGRNEFLLYAENFENNVVTYGIPRGFPQEKAPKGLLVDHSYRMYPMDIDENGRISKFKLIDPHSIIEIPISYEEIKKIGGIVDIAKKNNPTGSQTVSFKGRQITLNGTLRKKSLSPSLLKDAGFSDDDFYPDALRFLRKLNPNVIKHMNSVDKKGDYFARLLTKTGEFENINFDHIKNMADFLNLLGYVRTDNKTLISQLDDMSFVTDKYFDIEAWGDFVFAFDNKLQYDDKTFLEKFLGDIPFPELIYSSEFDPNVVLDFIHEIKSRTKFCTQEDTLKILDFVSSFAQERYNSLQRVDALSYFQNLRDNKGQEVFPQKNQQISQLEAFKYMLNINPASVDASNIQMLIDLVSQGVVDRHVFESLPLNGKLNYLVVEDIDKLYEAYINGIEPIDAFVPTFKTNEEALDELKTGDVYALDGEKYISILGENGLTTKLNISKEIYFDLFPPIERYATTQGPIGNCWQITGMNSIFRDARERVNILKLFYEDGNDILIKFPFGAYEEIRFENAKLPDAEKEVDYSKGAKGFKFVEYADGRELQVSRIKNYFLYLIKELANAQSVQEKNEVRRKITEAQKLMKLGAENIVVRQDLNSDKWLCYKFDEKSAVYNSAEVEGRNGGDTVKFYERIGYKNTSWLPVDDEIAQHKLLSPKTFEQFIVSWTTKDILDSSYFDELGIHQNHAYSLNADEVDKNGKIKSYQVIDPWGCVQVKLTLEQLKKFGNYIQLAERKSYK